MKILLVGEYSGLHNALKEGLLRLGHEVLLVSSGDFFKQYPSDIILKRKYDQGFGRKLKVLLHKLFDIDITSASIKHQFLKVSEKLKGFDVVQLINENPLTTQPESAKEVITFLKLNNKKLFLLSCGTDYVSVSHALSDAHPYSILYDYKNGHVEKKKYQHILSYLSKTYRELHEFVYDQIDGVIASDLDYHLPLVDHPKYLGLIPNPVVLSKLSMPPIKTEFPIRIFMGVNRNNSHTKGIRFFKTALETIKSQYPDKVTVEIVENLPYATYIEKYNRAHILLDQVLAYDQGYNALEAMAKGKVVFTGAETAFYEHYSLSETVAVNALPDPTDITQKLSELISNPSKIEAIGHAARSFVRKEHDHVKVAAQYIAAWNG